MSSRVSAREERFYSYSDYLEDLYGKRAYRVAVDAGFSCPNRGSDRSRPGCTYCDEYGAQAVYQDGYGRDFFDRENMRFQIDRGVRFMVRRYRAEIFLLYFQAFSSTWGEPETLKSMYDFGLSLHPFRELIVSTRPDCISPEIAALLQSYRRGDFDVWVEMGLQSAHDVTLRRVNRGHAVQDFISASQLLRDLGIKQTVHLIFGLPGENWDEIEESLRLIIDLGIEGVKIHNLHIPKGAPMHHEYLQGELTVPHDMTHLDYVVRALEILPPDMIVHRVTTDTPSHRLTAPKNFWPKGLFYAKLREELIRRDTRQGARFRKA